MSYKIRNFGRTEFFKTRIIWETVNGKIRLDDTLAMVSPDKVETKTIREWIIEWGYKDAFILQD